MSCPSNIRCFAFRRLCLCVCRLRSVAPSIHSYNQMKNLFTSGIQTVDKDRSILFPVIQRCRSVSRRETPNDNNNNNNNNPRPCVVCCVVHKRFAKPPFTMTMTSASASAYPAASPSSVVSQPPISMNYDDSDRRSNTAMDTPLPAPLPTTNDEGDGRQASVWELICNYVIGKAKPLLFGQLLAFWLVSIPSLVIFFRLMKQCNRMCNEYSHPNSYCFVHVIVLVHSSNKGVHGSHTIKIAP